MRSAARGCQRYRAPHDPAPAGGLLGSRSEHRICRRLHGESKPTMNSKRTPADIVQSPLQEPRLPPGQVRTEKWPVLHYGSVPQVDLNTWEFRVDGLVTKPARWTWNEFQALPQ